MKHKTHRTYVERVGVSSQMELCPMNGCLQQRTIMLTRCCM